jgi:hypothetical protein
VLVTGGSAGGIGTFLNVDYIQTRLPHAIVKGAPNAGWFFPSDPTTLPTGAGYPQLYADFVAGNPSVWDNSTDVLWDAYPIPECAASMVAAGRAAWYCGSIHNAYPFIKAPLMVIENQVGPFNWIVVTAACALFPAHSPLRRCRAWRAQSPRPPLYLDGYS